jgi:hypothetical protein
MVDEGAALEAVARARLRLALLAEERLIDVVRSRVLRRQRPLLDPTSLLVEIPVDVAHALDQARQDARDEEHAEAAHLRLLLAAHRRLDTNGR